MRNEDEEDELKEDEGGMPCKKSLFPAAISASSFD
jgi:hypothetical protein